MKLSNIIITTFGLLFIIYVFGIAAEIRLRGEERQSLVNQPHQQFQQGCSSDYRKDVQLPSFKILKINKISELGYIKFRENTPNVFTVFSESESELPDLEYHKSGDTLVIDRMNKQGLCKDFRLELGNPNIQIIADKMRIHLSSEISDFQRLALKGSNTSFHFLGNIEGFKVIDSLQVDLINNSSINSHSIMSVKHITGEVSKNSRIELYNFKVESAKVQIGGQSQIRIDGQRYDNPDSSVKLIYQKTNQ